MTETGAPAPEDATDEAQAETLNEALEMAHGKALTQPSEEAVQGAPRSGFTYRTVTRYWPRIAVGLVVVVGIAEWVVEGLTSNGALEFYVFVWATATGGLWYIFEKAEGALSAETKATAFGWMQQTQLKSVVSG
jgi:hypothetical protein